MDILNKRFIHLKRNEFQQGGETIEYYSMQLEDPNHDNAWESELSLTVSTEIVEQLELDNEEMVDELRGKDVKITGVMYDQNVGYHDKQGNPRERTVQKFKVYAIDLV